MISLRIFTSSDPQHHRSAGRILPQSREDAALMAHIRQRRADRARGGAPR